MLIFSPLDWEIRANCALKNGETESAAMQKEFCIPEATYSALNSGTEFKALEFAESVPLSTYLYCFVAGPYDVFTPKTEDPDLAVPLGLLCRKSMSKYAAVAAEDWFRVTRAGIKYYEKMFQCPYPFDKLDQILCPDF
jgi:aminopeptidase N